jgi:predicted acylesterase/phospholipase RssA
VTTVCTENVPHIRLFRSYDADHNLEHDCEIWEAARATSAAPTYFSPIEIGPPGQRTTFVDGGLGCNNPIYQLHLETERLFKSSRNVACIVSLGTGLRKTNDMSRSNSIGNIIAPMKLINSIKKLAIDCEHKAEDMDLKYRGTKDVYFRLNVERGLEGIKLADWDQLATIRIHTMAYLEQPSIADSIKCIASLLAETNTQRRAYPLGLLCKIFTQLSMPCLSGTNSTSQPSPAR